MAQARGAAALPARLLSALAFAGAGLSACAVGPDYAPPPAPQAAHMTPEPTASPGDGQRFVEGGDIPGEWWALFRSKPLDRLVREALENNPSLQAAEASIKIAYFNAEAHKGVFLPQIDFTSNESANLQSNNRALGAINQSVFNESFPTPMNILTGPVPNVPTNTPNAFYGLFLKQLSISYMPDVWGLNARTQESLDAQAEQQRWQMEAARLSLTGNVIVAAIQEASIRGQIEATTNIISISRESLDILKRQESFGSIAKAEVVAQEAALAQAEQTLPPLEKQLALQRNLLTALAGRFSFEGPGESFDLANFKLPSTLPVSLPGQIIEQRPDIKVASANLHAACAEVGVAVANRLPNLTLSANLGFSAFRAAQLFAPGTEFYTLAANVAQPIFNGAALFNKQRAAEAGLEQANAQYRSTVINAFQNVADALRALQADAKAVQTARHAEDAAKRSLDIVRMQLKYGQVSQIQVFNSQRIYLLTSLSRVQAEATRLADTAGLFVALGGGWWRAHGSSGQERRDERSQSDSSGRG